MNIDCPNCDNVLIGPPEVVGKKVKCTLCNHVFIAPEPVADDNLNDDTFSSWLEEDYEQSVQQEIAAHEEHERKLREMKSYQKSQKEKQLTDKDRAEKSNRKRRIPFKKPPVAPKPEVAKDSLSLDDDSLGDYAPALDDTNIDDIEISFIDEEAERKKRKESRLRKKQAKQHNPTLPEQTLTQINQWAGIQSDEGIQEYIPDADITHAEQGTAGIVLTSQRLCYRKYHHQGSVYLEDGEAMIQAKQEADSYTLSLFKGPTRQRMVRLSGPAFDQLKALLAPTKIKMKTK
ncbi:hypothetical protein JD969_11115 [Planctomycetota bacterium]|nr:hypothetical protein JD969_11115 [Planctomycetota bacterium]